jgi:probable rRNA maturation factor
MSTEINNESGVEVNEAALAEVSRFVLDALHINPLAELSVVLLDADAMAALHQQWMNLPGPTDVMAFPMDGGESSTARIDPSSPHDHDPHPGEALLGDVVLCPVVAADQASSAGHSLEAELHLLTVHGILHLLGYDHGEAGEEQEMFDLQAKLLGEWTTATGRPAIRAPRAGTGGEVRDTAGGRRG